MPKNQTQNSQPPTRDQLVGAMLTALRTKGFHGVGLSELLAQAQAPKGVLYHHFPGGKTELAVAAIDHVVQHISSRLEHLLSQHRDPSQALAQWMKDAQKALLGSGYEAGCPLATIALGTPNARQAWLSTGHGLIWRPCSIMSQRKAQAQFGW